MNSMASTAGTIALIAGTLVAAVVQRGPCSAAGKPKWAQTAVVKVGPQAGKMVVADFNTDGKPDIAVACGACCGDSHCEDGGHVAILLGDGKGGFSQPGKAIKVGPTALCVAAGDLNGDKAIDLIVGEHDTYNITVLLGDGKGAFAPGPGSPCASREGKRPHTHDVALGDVTGDGTLDAVAINANDNTISVLAGDGKGGFAPASGSPFAAGRHPYEGLRLVDVNGDKALDAVVSNVAGNGVSVLLNDGRGWFAQAPGSPHALGERPGYVNVADVNGDLKADIVSTHDDSGLVKTLLGDGKGGFTPGPERKFEGHLWGTALADMDGDGSTDLAVAGWMGQVYIYRGDGVGGFGPQHVVLECAGQPSYVVAADFNADGRMDLAASAYKSGEVRVWQQE